MRIDNISNNNFQGKFIMPKKLTKKEQEFANELINYRFNGLSNKEYLESKNFDVNILGRKNKKSTHRKLYFHIGLNHIGTKANERGMDITTIKADSARLDEGVTKAAYNLRYFIDSADSYIENNLPTQYNTKFQKFIVKAKMFLGFV